MSIKDLFDETQEERTERTEYNKGKEYCCEEVCEHINAYIENEKHRIKDVISETIVTPEERKIVLSKKDVKSDAESKLELLKDLKIDIHSDKPYCICK